MDIGPGLEMRSSRGIGVADKNVRAQGRRCNDAVESPAIEWVIYPGRREEGGVRGPDEENGRREGEGGEAGEVMRVGEELVGEGGSEV